jgi:hypothetical protein
MAQARPEEGAGSQGLFNEYSPEDESAVDYMNEQAQKNNKNSYNQSDDKIAALSNKYAEMLRTRLEYGNDDIDITKCVPTLEELFTDDLAYDIYKELADSEDEKDVLDTVFYTQVPNLDVGYRSDNTFVLEVDKATFIKDLDKLSSLNSVDGDTLRFPVSSIKPIGTFSHGGTSYTDFDDYCLKNKLIGLNKEENSNLALRSVGIDCPEIPHYEILAIPKTESLETMTIGEAKNKDALYQKYNNDGTDRKNNDTATFYKKGSTYVEVIGDRNSMAGYAGDNIDKTKYDVCKIVSSDESNKATIVNGLKAKDLYVSTVKSASKIYLKVDANGLMATKTSGAKLYYNYWWNGHKVIATLVDQWKNSMRDNAPLTRLSISPFGTDAYGRLLGEVYAEINLNGKPTMVNVNKYVLAKVDNIKANPTFTNSPEQNNTYGTVSDSFELMSYDKNNQIYLDSMSEQTKESYEGRLKLHKEITGIDFEAFRNCTMMLGDTLFLIPPTNIRNTSQVEYEKLGVLRGKGSMVKGLTAREQYLEIDLYFYDEYGINGIPYDCTLPNGKKMTYYMDGLLSLLAQFKVAPYLPIENQYINDVLGIEAVSFVSVSYSTLEEYPRLLKATLTLRDFNYRIYMPDLPIDINEETSHDISKMNPIFAKCFHWEVFRYYYQRQIANGLKLSLCEYNSKEYNQTFYSSKNALKPVNWCEFSDCFSLYVPDENWLKNALALKKYKDYYGQVVTPLDLSENAKAFINKLASIRGDLKVPSAIGKELINNTNVTGKPAFTNSDGDQTNKNVFYNGTSFITSTSNKPTTDYIHSIVDPIAETGTTTGVLNYNSTDEILNKRNNTLTWRIKFDVVTSSLTSDDLLTIKELLKDLVDERTINNILTNNTFYVDINAKLISDNKKINRFVSVESENQIVELLYNQGSYFDNGQPSQDPGDNLGNLNNYVEEVYDYTNPSAMEFIPYIENIQLQGLAMHMANSFTELSLKIMEGSAPQYMGASDTVIELRIVTDDMTTISMLNVLPAHSMNIAKTYRRILNCWPLRIRNHYVNMAGINEVIIDSINIDNVEGYPGLYTIIIRFTSVDRIMRQREQLQQLDSKEETTQLPEAKISSYFDIETTLASVELYPDLDLPTLSELSQVGYKFIKYNNANVKYPDPDFYMVYGYEYTAKMIKKCIKDVLLEQGLLLSDEKEKKEYGTNMTVQDNMGEEFDIKFCETGSQIVDDSLNDVAKWHSESLNESIELDELSINRVVKGKTAVDKNQKELQDAANDFLTLTMLDVQEGWEVRPGWKATMASDGINEPIRICSYSNECTSATPDEDRNNEQALKLFEFRKDAITYIDNILSKPADWKSWGENSMKKKETASGDINTIMKQAVKQIFHDDSDGAALIKMLCPFCETSNLDTVDFNDNKGAKKYFEHDNVLNFIQAFLHASGCTLTGMTKKTSSGDYYMDYGPRHWYVKDGKAAQDKSGKEIPLCHCESAKGSQAKSRAEAIKNGVDFGMYAITRESKSKILERIKPVSNYSNVDYLGGPDSKENKTLAMYKNYKDGFIDPYYNKLSKNDEEYQEYVTKIATSPMCNAIAFLRIVLVYLRKQIIDGYLISEIDWIAYDWDNVKEQFVEGNLSAGQEVGITLSSTLKNASPKSVWDQLVHIYKAAERDENSDAGFWEGLWYSIGGNEVVPETDSKVLNGLMKMPIAGWLVEGGYNYYKELKGEVDTSKMMANMGISEEEASTLNNQLENLTITYARSFCMRLIYPFVEAATQTCEGKDTNLENYLINRKFDALNAMASSLSMGSTKTSEPLTKFLLALGGQITGLPMDDTTASTTSDAQKILNIILREAFTKLSEDPRYYILHSFYDMLTNDKRGRLLRAFPTYYIVFIDEGRKIGSWKLFDNFYNMSAVSEITVTKSRKLPTDTCSFVMTNMFNSYAEEYDTTTRQQYVDLYSYRDTFLSIFNPVAYIKKEDAIRRRRENTETVVLKPGVRLHIRMGYGANASKLPTVFNGKVAEVNFGDVVEVIGQGDGSELLNPLNTLGDIETTALIESQQFCTLLKDFRGSMARGGLSPRNFLAQLLTAEHGGIIKSIARDITSDRVFADNPFGIYHFGDKRFADIFAEGEAVQNLYEVVDGSLLTGINSLCSTDGTQISAPTINTTLQDKTFWDILQLCAYSGLGYIGAIRDFGFRSTVCLCKPNQYYAYAYQIMDGKYVEKRKPFQQFHYLNSYTDIIYNSLKATEKNMKTNATGIWEGTDLIWGSSSKTCGPIYLDMNIYPEYQKSMTVDTGLVAAGNGGIDIPFMNWASESWNMSDKADKVNKSLAERITTNTLRESVMNMYAGEIGIVGNASIKPHDRVSLVDTYEDMTGQVEVEAVVHSMNFNTGFTTTVYPDLIVRQEDQYEATVQRIDNSVSACLTTAVTVPCGFFSVYAAVTSKIVRALANNNLTEVDEKAMAQFSSSSIGRVLGLDQLDTSTQLSIASFYKKIGGVAYQWSMYTMPSLCASYAIVQSARSWLTRWLRNIQALDVYPIFKNNRPLIAGMSGHRGSVVGYEYSEEEKKDSLQGMISAVYNSFDNSLFGLGEYLLAPVLNLEEFNKIQKGWATTLTGIDLGEDNSISREQIAQETLKTVTLENASRGRTNNTIRTKYRIKKFDTNNGTSPTYLRYRNLGITIEKNLPTNMDEETLKPIGDTGIVPTNIYSNKNVLDLYPIEDDEDVKLAVAKNHPSGVEMYIAHSKGPLKANIPFESGARIIRFISEQNPNSTFADYPILDMPMVQEDAMYIIKYLLNMEQLKKKQLIFLSGTRLNDTKTWKNTGFQFTLQCKDKEALKKAVSSLKSEVVWTIGGKQCPIFNYQMSDNKCIITVYAEADENELKENK